MKKSTYLRFVPVVAGCLVLAAGGVVIDRVTSSDATSSNGASSNDRPWLRTTESPQLRARQLVARMTLDEKLSQVSTSAAGRGGGGIARLVPGIPRLGVPDFRIANGPAGLGSGTTPKQASATALPAPVALAASFDPDLAGRYGTVEGRETANSGYSLLEAPSVNIVRVPGSGRAFENYGEDPYLAGQLAVANIHAIQSQGVLAEVKHFVANDQETDRLTINEKVDDRTLHEIYLPPFEAAVKQGDVAAVMCAYPSVNDEFMCQNAPLLNRVLRGQWGFGGFVQSDAGATHSAVGSVQAGQDLELAAAGPYHRDLRQAVLDGKVSESSLSTLIERRMATEIRFGLFDHPVRPGPIDAAAGGRVARAVSEQGTVLLKNSGKQLPLNPATVHSIAVIGRCAQSPPPAGGGSSHVNPLYTVTPAQGIRRRAGSAVTVTSYDGSDTGTAVQRAAAADVAVVVVSDQESEGSDRMSLALPGNQNQLVAAVAAANPHTVVVVDSGGPVLMPWLGAVPAVLEAWYPGEEAGNALAAVLFGDVNPSGKLPVTFPASDATGPLGSRAQFPGVDGTVSYTEGLRVGYRWYGAQHVRPLFPFGYGLSYTSFRYGQLTVSPAADHHDVTVTVDVTNTGDRAGADVVQVYLSYPPAAGEPPNQLRAFRKVSLDPGQTRTVSLTLDRDAFTVWNSSAQAWRTVAGTYPLSVGDSSADLPLHASVTMPATP
ncbi:beta-glucosidase [Rugosimonospora africana]|uniref:Glycosyl hydrolase n=1 Tax=Rugosimonospora africana TaxID=556532 RepID=A0A8J3QPZ5_9ACTN|nr:glycoside hydrolase family 3 C-terminal domain-containing protein [Rugosimonospora africana]GIH14359.1 glycosyl hydrolase [Rugosimonospora africana]